MPGYLAEVHHVEEWANGEGHQAVLGVRPDQLKDGLGVGPVGA